MLQIEIYPQNSQTKPLIHFVKFFFDLLNLYDSRDSRILFLQCLILDIESEPPPEPAPPEILPSSYNHRDRDISMASINAVTIKQPSNFVLKIDKNGDQIHEEFIPQNQHGKLTLDN